MRARPAGLRLARSEDLPVGTLVRSVDRYADFDLGLVFAQRDSSLAVLALDGQAAFRYRPLAQCGALVVIARNDQFEIEILGRKKIDDYYQSGTISLFAEGAYLTANRRATGFPEPITIALGSWEIRDLPVKGFVPAFADWRLLRIEGGVTLYEHSEG